MFGWQRKSARCQSLEFLVTVDLVPNRFLSVGKVKEEIYPRPETSVRGEF